MLALLSQPLSTAGAAFALFMVYTASACTCVGIIPAVPVLLYGAMAYMLRLVDGDAEIADVFAAKSDLGRVIVSGWLLILLFALVMLPNLSVAFAMQAAQGAGVVGPWAVAGATALMGVVWSCAVAPISMTTWLWVDRGLPPVACFQASWSYFRPSWAPLCVVQVVSAVIMFPLQLAAIALAPYQSELQSNPGELGEAFAMLMAINGFNLVYGVFSGALAFAFYAHAFRQVIPRRAPSAPVG